MASYFLKLLLLGDLGPRTGAAEVLSETFAKALDARDSPTANA